MTASRIKTLLGLLYGLVMLGLGLGLMGLLPIGGDFGFEAFVIVLSKADSLLVMLIFLCTLVNFLIVASRWRLTAKAFAPPDTPHTMSYLFYTALMHLFAQVLPTTVCTFTVRNITMRFHENIPIARGTLSILYDQVYEIMVPFLFILPSMLVITGAVTPSDGLLISMAIGIVAMLIVKRLGASLTALFVHFICSVPLLRRLFAGIDKGDLSMLENGTFQQRLVTKMFGLALLRYLNTALRACLVAWACGLGVKGSAIFFAMPLVQLTFLVGITPAAMGFVEWGSVGALMLLSIPASDAANYAVIHRVFLIASVVAVSLMIGIVHVIIRLRGPVGRCRTVP